MTQLATLNLKNQAEVDVPFLVEGVNYTTNVATWRHAGSSYDLSNRASFSLVPPTARQTRARVKAMVKLPVVDMTGTKIDEVIASVEFVLPKTSNLGHRSDVLAFMTDFLTQDVIINAVKNYEGVY